MPRRNIRASQRPERSVGDRRSASAGDSRIPETHRETWVALTHLTDATAFQSVCDAVLSARLGFEIRPRGQSVHGTVKGQPDSWGYDRDRRVCAMCYGTDANWQRKLKKDLVDLRNVVSASFQPQMVVFCTNRHISADAEREWKQRVADTYGWELQLYGPGELAVALDVDLPHLRAQYLGLPLRRHSWESLLEACRKHLDMVQVQLPEAYDPSLYVTRAIEQRFADIYREAIGILADGKPQAQLLPIVDQSGAGKSTLALHLATTYGAQGPVIMLLGSLLIHGAHALEHAIVSAVGYPVTDGVFQADLAYLCSLTEAHNRPLVVIIDGIDRGDVNHMREALAHLLAVHRERGLLVVVTCRDILWPHMASHEPALQAFNVLAWADGSYTNMEESPAHAMLPPGPSSNGPAHTPALSLGPLSPEEFLEARDRYLERWNVEASIAVEVEGPLRVPLLLRIFAEGAQGKTLGLVTHLADRDLWGRYLGSKIQAVSHRVGWRLRPEAIEERLERLALLMLRADTTVLARGALEAEWTVLQDNLSPGSLYFELEAAGLLVEEPERGIRFTFDLLLDYVLGQALARQLDAAHDPSDHEEALQLLQHAAERLRWRHVVRIAVGLAREPEVVIDRLRKEHLWAAAHALEIVASGSVRDEVRAAVIRDLIVQLGSRYAFDRGRAATLLGALQASESRKALIRAWHLYRSSAMLCALARLGVEEITLPLIRHLGNSHYHYLPERQLLVNKLPDAMRSRVQREAVLLLKAGGQESEADDATAAAQTLGYLRNEQIIEPLMTYLAGVSWSDLAALLALWRLGTPEGDAALERALDAVGAIISDEQEKKNSAQHPPAASKDLENSVQSNAPPHDQRTSEPALPSKDVGAQRDQADQVEGEVVAAQSTELTNHIAQTTPLISATSSALIGLRTYGFQHSAPARTTPFLMRLLDQPWFSICDMAVQSLAMLRAAETAPILVTSGRIWDSSWGIRSAINDALHAFGTLIPVEPFIQLVDDPNIPDGVLSFAVTALGESRNPKAFPALRDLLTRRRPPTWHTIYALGRSGHIEAVPVLAAFLEEPGDSDEEPGDSDHLDQTENLTYHVVSALGSIQHPSAYPILARWAERDATRMNWQTFEVLIATGRDRALPFAVKVWMRHQGDSLSQSLILSALLWLGSQKAIKTIEALLEPLREETLLMLIKALHRGMGLSLVIGGRRGIHAPAHFFQLIGTWFNKFSVYGQWQALLALRDGAREGTETARAVLERVACDPSQKRALVSENSEPFPTAPGAPARTVQSEALTFLARIGSPVALDFVLDQLSYRPEGFVEYELSTMPRDAVAGALVARLQSAVPEQLAALLRIAGWYGDERVLPVLNMYCDEHDSEIADAAYEAAERLRGRGDW